jgi:hypothetical protein
MKQFYPTYLYIKTHNDTGLKYFGKTTSDPHAYYGSGKHWVSHLKKHGYNISTEIVGFFISKDECQDTALRFSMDNCIVESTEWANLIIENGLDGGNTNRTVYKPHTEESKKKMSESRKGRIPWNKGKTGVTPGNKTARSEETKKRISDANLGKTQSQETIEKRSAKLKGHVVTLETRKKISDGNKGKKLSEERVNQMKNRVVSDSTKKKISDALKGHSPTEETKKKLSGTVCVVDKHGNRSKILKEQYYSQVGPKNNWNWVSHKSKEANERIK